MLRVIFCKLYSKFGKQNTFYLPFKYLYKIKYKLHISRFLFVIRSILKVTSKRVVNVFSLYHIRVFRKMSKH